MVLPPGATAGYHSILSLPGKKSREHSFKAETHRPLVPGGQNLAVRAECQAGVGPKTAASSCPKVWAGSQQPGWGGPLQFCPALSGAEG